MTKWAHPVMQRTFGALVVAVLCLCGAGGLAAANAMSTDVIFTMSGSNGQVGGLQMDLSWDPTCMTVERQEGDAASCNSNPATRKNVQTKIFANNSTMRVLFLSVSDTGPVPDDELFSCRFTLASAPSSPCCSLTIGNVIFGYPRGGRNYDPNITVQALVNGTPCGTAGPSGSPDNPARPPVPAAAVPVAPAPVVSAPGALPGVHGAPARPAALPPAAEAPETTTGQAAPPSEEIPPTESATQPAIIATPRTPTPLRTPVRATATASGRTPPPHSTATAAVTGSTTPGSTTPTPAPTAKKHRKKHTP